MTETLGVTLVVTSCGRLDLLQRTLDSLFAVERRFDRTIVVEDSGDASVADEIRRHWPEATVLLNQPRLGQMRAIDRAYGEVETPWIFHCEDDWVFDAPPVLDEAVAFMTANPKISVACVRRVSELHPRFVRRLEPAPGSPFAPMPADAHPEWFGYSFNPSLARRSFHEAYGPFADRKSEDGLSWRAKTDGWTMAFLLPGVAAHIGDERHVDDPTLKKRRKTVLGKFRRSIEKRVTRIRRALELG